MRPSLGKFSNAMSVETTYLPAFGSLMFVALPSLIAVRRRMYRPHAACCSARNIITSCGSVVWYIRRELCAGRARLLEQLVFGIPCGLSSAQRNNCCNMALLCCDVSCPCSFAQKHQFSPDAMTRITGFKTQKAQWLLSSE
jgi:hypothetical protein